MSLSDNENWETVRELGMKRYLNNNSVQINKNIKNYLQKTRANYAIMGGKAAIHTIAPVKRDIKSSKNYDMYVWGPNFNQVTLNLTRVLKGKAVPYKLKLKKDGHTIVQFVLTTQSGFKKVNKNTGTWNSIANLHKSKEPLRSLKSKKNGLRYISNNRLISELANTIKDKGPQNSKYAYRKQRLDYLKSIRTFKKYIKRKTRLLV